MHRDKDAHLSLDEIEVLLSGEDIPNELSDHAKACKNCARMLADQKEVAAILSNLASDEDWRQEDELINSLKSSTFQGRRELARRMASNSGAPRRQMPRQGWWLAAAACAIVASGIAGWAWWSRAHAPQRLIAKAYSEHRTMEFRIDGGGFALLHAERASATGRLSQSPSLLEAEAAIARRLESSPNDGALMHLSGRTDLLEGDVESALSFLIRARDVLPADSSVLVDLASAYGQRAMNGRPEDAATAIDLLGQALAMKSNDPVALYNRGIIAERMFLYRQAILDWEAYLKIESQGDWATDVKKRLNKVKEQLRRHPATSKSKADHSPRDVRPFPHLHLAAMEVLG